eukprot:12599394-Heterocapsa_arctica.AAC.1
MRSAASSSSASSSAIGAPNAISARKQSGLLDRRWRTRRPLVLKSIMHELQAEAPACRRAAWRTP